MKTKILVTLALGTMAGMAGGCSSAARNPKPVYDPSQTGTMLQVIKAEVIAVRDVEIKAATIPTGSTGPVGAVTGGAVASVITGSAGAIGRAVGAVVGGAIGSDADAKTGEEITLSIEGRTVIIVQERSNPPLAPGESVLVLTPSGGGPVVYGGRSGVLGTSVRGGGVRVIREERFAVTDTLAARGL